MADWSGMFTTRNILKLGVKSKKLNYEQLAYPIHRRIIYKSGGNLNCSQDTLNLMIIVSVDLMSARSKRKSGMIVKTSIFETCFPFYPESDWKRCRLSKRSSQIYSFRLLFCVFGLSINHHLAGCQAWCTSTTTTGVAGLLNINFIPMNNKNIRARRFRT